MHVEDFDELLSVTRQQKGFFRLLLVFSRRQPLVHEAAGEQAFFSPVAIVDKDPDYLQGFAALADEAKEKVGEWDALIVAALPGRADQPPTVQAIDEGGEKMVRAICTGMISDFLIFDRQGLPLDPVLR